MKTFTTASPRHLRFRKQLAASHFTTLLFALTIAAPTSMQAQSCVGNPNLGCSPPKVGCVGCTPAGSACTLPAAAGKGKCETPSGLPKGELSCECTPQKPPPLPLFDIISRPTPPAGVDIVVRIDKPNPQAPSTEYPQITFQPGDTITIDAGGCVQGGGHGLTTRQYVSPIDSDNRYYHGLITIPFGTQVLTRIQEYWKKSVHIPSTAPADKLHLQLGYEDETGQYGDNGYYSLDNGPANQCAGSLGSPAWVQLAIKHNGPAPPKTTGGDFDLLWTDYDANGIPMNPDWRSKSQYNRNPDPTNCVWEWQGSGLPSCTNQLTNTDTWFGCSSSIPFFNQNNSFGLDGHANYFAATFDGKVSWESKSGPLTDDEYSMDLATTGAAGGLSPARPLGVHVEFARDETIDILTDDFGLPWWQGLRNAVDNGNGHGYLDGDYMIVTGLMGLDFYHSPGPESHPAWAMAIQGSSNSATDIWAIFVHNWGQEGYCSGSIHTVLFPNNQYTFNLRWQPGATSATVASTSFWTNAATPVTFSVNVIQGQAIQLTFYNIPDPSARALIGGELHVAWVGGPSGPVVRPPVATDNGGDQEDEAEGYVMMLTAGLNPAQRAIYNANLPSTKRVPGPKSAVKLESRSPLPLRAKSNQQPKVSAVPDSALSAKKDAQMNVLKKAYGGTLPELKK